MSNQSNAFCMLCPYNMDIAKELHSEVNKRRIYCERK